MALYGIIIGFVLMVVGGILVRRTPWVFFVGACFLVVSVFIMAFQADQDRVDRQRRTYTKVGGVVDVNKEETDDKCSLTFKLKFRNDSRNYSEYKKLPYTFEVDCSPLRKGDVVWLVFVVPKEEDGKPEVLQLLNMTFAIEHYSAPASLPPEAPSVE